MGVRASIIGDRFVVMLDGFDAVWALKRRLSIPLAEITGARVLPRDEALHQLRWRVGGTAVPNVLCAGHFTLRSGPGRGFAVVYRDPEVLTITTTRERPRVVVLQHHDRHELAAALSSSAAGEVDGPE